ncbi:MAG: hypothetical protein Q9217_003834 [Psora testacea]
MRPGSSQLHIPQSNISLAGRITLSDERLSRNLTLNPRSVSLSEPLMIELADHSSTSPEHITMTLTAEYNIVFYDYFLPVLPAPRCYYGLLVLASSVNTQRLLALPHPSADSIYTEPTLNFVQFAVRLHIINPSRSLQYNLLSYILAAIGTFFVLSDTGSTSWFVEHKERPGSRIWEGSLNIDLPGAGDAVQGRNDTMSMDFFQMLQRSDWRVDKDDGIKTSRM